MKNRQYSLKVFETTVKDEKSFIAFFDINYFLFKDHLILIQGELSDRIRQYLETKSLKFLHNQVLPIGRSRKGLEKEFQKNTNKEVAEENTILMEKNRALLYKNFSLQKEIKTLTTEKTIVCQREEAEIQKAKNEIKKLSQRPEKKFTVSDAIIRSGRELDIDGDLLLLNRVNSGAMVHTAGNLIATEAVEGALRCDGDFMMVSDSPKANIIFNNIIVENALLIHKLNRIELKENEIYITPVIKKEINWV